YDAAGRLTQANDVSASTGTCATRTYAYDVNSNRTSSVVYPAASDNTCQSATGGMTTSHSYDGGDRLLSAGGDSGGAYGTFRRVATVPSADVAGGGNVTATYYTNDLVRSQSQGTTTQTWTVDTAGRLSGWTVAVSGSTTATKTNHYDDASSDSPDWIAETSDSS